MGERTSRTFDLSDCVAWRLDQERSALIGQQVDNGRPVPPRAESEARLSAAKAALAEDELQESRGRLIPVEQLEDLVRQPLEAVDVKLRTARRRHGKSFASKLGISQAEAMALIDEIVEPIRADLRAVFE